MVLRSTDGGCRWQPVLQLPASPTQERPPAEVGLEDVEADGIAHGSRSDDVVVSVTRPAGLRGWSPGARRYIDLDPSRFAAHYAPLSDVQATRERRPRFVLLGQDALLTYRGAVGADIRVRSTTVTPRRGTT